VNNSPVQNDNTPNDDDNGPSMTTLLIVAGFLVVVSWFIATTLRHFGGIQDCVMQGRTNCVTLPDSNQK
jgi:hypothetical protein